MRKVKYILFRYITPSDFKNIYKPKGAEEKGGGQSYIDISTSQFNRANRTKFFENIRSRDPGEFQKWQIKVNSIGCRERDQLVQMSLRRKTKTSIKIDNQKIDTRKANRIKAWHPQNGFPRPQNKELILDAKKNETAILRELKGLAVFIVRTDKSEYWAGWFRDRKGGNPCKDEKSEILLHNLIHNQQKKKKGKGYCGFLEILDDSLCLNENDKRKPFFYNNKARTPIMPIHLTIDKNQKPSKKERIFRPRSEESLIKALFSDDQMPGRKGITKEVRTVIERNQKAAKKLKELYKRCQLTGGKDIFTQRNKKPYLEVHHLIPLGAGGDDWPENLIIVSPKIHRMLHYANVSGIDLNKIKNNKLSITINDEKYSIQWHDAHAQRVLSVRNKQ